MNQLLVINPVGYTLLFDSLFNNSQAEFIVNNLRLGGIVSIYNGLCNVAM